MININVDERRGVAIEPQDNQLNKPLIKKGNYYSREIKYSFIKK